MFSRLTCVCVVFVALFGQVCDDTSAQESAYSVAQTFALHRDSNGTDGTLRLLIDKRLTPTVFDQMWNHGDWSFVYPPGSELHDQFAADPPHNPKLRLADGNGKIIANRDLPEPLAKMEVWSPRSASPPIFLLSVDFSKGFGSYSGPVTTLLDVSASSFQDIEALNTRSQQKDSIRLPRSLKSDWQIQGHEKGTDILYVSCRPRPDGSFFIEYIRYSLVNGQWLAYERKADGLWESDDPFPDASQFP